MKCMDPVLCYTTSKKKYFRHFSLASPIIKSNHQHKFDCGKCIFCRKKRATELAVRCVLHASMYDQNCFLTLTYDEKKEGYHNNFQYKDIQQFKKRLRRYVSYHFHKTIQIFNVHEYGKNGKKHWHLVVFGYCPDDKKNEISRSSIPYYTSKTLQKLWPHGFHTIGDVTEASAMYQAQYTQKDLKNGNQNNSKKAHSKHSGIGKPYFLKHYSQILRLGFIPFANKKIPIPRYFQRLAHKHYCHFYEKSAFFDTLERKRKYNPFKMGEENYEIANLFNQFQKVKFEKQNESWLEWQEEISDYIWTKEKPDFWKAGKNYLHDLNNKNSKGEF